MVVEYSMSNCTSFLGEVQRQCVHGYEERRGLDQKISMVIRENHRNIKDNKDETAQRNDKKTAPTPEPEPSDRNTLLLENQVNAMLLLKQLYIHRIIERF